MWSKWRYLKRNISCDAHLLNELLETDVPWYDAIVVSAGKLRKLWDCLSELRSSVFERRLAILPVSCRYFLSLMNFIINNRENFQTRSSVHNINTRIKHHLHKPTANLSCLKKNTIYAGIRTFNSSLPSVTVFMCDKTKFKAAFRKYLNKHSSYSVDEFFIRKLWIHGMYVYKQSVHKWMVQFQKLTRNLFLTLHGQTVHRQQRQLSQFLMC